MKNKGLLGVLLVPALILLVPLVAMQFTDEVNWSLADFAVAWVLLAGAGLTYKLATGGADNLFYRAGAALALGVALLLIWINLAVGLIGSESHPANRIYFGVIAIGMIGAGLARLEPLGLARALFATALAQVLAPIIALAIWQPGSVSDGVKVFGLNAVFVLLFAGSALLFRRAAGTPSRAVLDRNGSL